MTAKRLQKLLSMEWSFWSRGFSYIAGVDEVGRGPLAGPVVAAAVILPPQLWIDGVGDSKKIPYERRQELARRIAGEAVAFGIGAASAREIDLLNIRRATALAMERAIRRLSIPPNHLLIDGLAVPELGLETQTPVVGGDGCVHCIGAASILAKVTRDRLMERLSHRHPQYGWEHNKGYGTLHHLDALARYGATRHHRMSFAPLHPVFPELELSSDAL